MNNVTLAHIGGELVVIGGVAFYFHRKTTLLEQQVMQLQKENRELAAAIDNLGEQMEQLAEFVMQGAPPAPRPRQQPQQPQQTPVPRQGRPTRPKAPPPVVAVDTAQRMPPRRRPAPSDDDDSGNETLDDRELDRELEKDLQELETSRSCEGDVCEL